MKKTSEPLVLSDLGSTGIQGDASAPTIANIVAGDLRDCGRLVELHQQAVELGWARDGYLGTGGLLDFSAAAVHAQRIVERDGGDACKLFAWIVRKGQWRVITNADEVPAHRRLREHLHPPLPRSTTPTLSADARFVQQVYWTAKRAGWEGLSPVDGLYAMLKDRLGDEWSQQRWDDGCGELRDGGGPVHVGRVLSAYLADRGVIEPTVKLFQAGESVQGVA